MFSAASGAGKTTILDRLRKAMPDLVYSISATTRPQRVDEVDGVHYFFLDEREFAKRVDAGEFAEWAEVHGCCYGTPRSFVDRTVSAGKHIVMDIDVYGKVQLDKVYPDAVGVFVMPPSRDVLEQRLRGRGTDSGKAVRLRLQNAQREAAFARAEGKYEYTVVNDDLDRAVAEVTAIVRGIITT